MHNSQQKVKTRHIQAKDFSNRAFFPGTEDHPFHTLNTLDRYAGKIPAILYPFLFGGLVYLLTHGVIRSIAFTGFILGDLLILVLLPKFKVSFGPPTLPMLFLAFFRFPFMVIFRLPMALGFQIAGTLMVIYGFIIEPQYPKVERYKVAKAIPGESGRLKIVHLSDLHMEYLTQADERAIEAINALQPDLIFFTGDFFNLCHRQDEVTNQDIVHFFNRIGGSCAIFAITGSPVVDPAESLSWVLPQTRIQLLNNKSARFEINGKRINIYGLTCTHRPGIDSQKLSKLLESAPPDGAANILLYHSPDLAPEIADSGIDLQLSGHTHGGQVQIPFLGPIFSASLYGNQLSEGHYWVNDRLNLIVSRGLGLEGNAAPRVRFLSPPEIGFISFEFLQDNVK